jgi:hypothetical protein
LRTRKNNRKLQKATESKRRERQEYNGRERKKKEERVKA